MSSKRTRSLMARRIEEIRLSKNMSRQALAEKIGTTRLEVWRRETGVTDVSAEDAALYADGLGVSVASLYRESKAAS